MTIPVTVPYDGRYVTLRDLARITGLKYETLSARYHKGDRGEDLIRAREVGGPKTIDGEKNEDIKKRRTVVELGRLKDAERLDRLRMRQERRRELRAKALADLQATLTRPLIAAGLLSKSERQRIRDRVKFSGQRSWAIDGGRLL